MQLECESLRYVAYAFGLVFSYLAQLHEGREFSPVQACSCFGIALVAVATWWRCGTALLDSKLKGQTHLHIQMKRRYFFCFFFEWLDWQRQVLFGLNGI